MLSHCRRSFCGQCHVLGFSEKLFLREELAPPVSTGEIFSEIRYDTTRGVDCAWNTTKL